MLTSSFDIARDAIIPFSNIKTCDDYVHVFAIVFVYMVLISGWVGYTKSISVRHHTNTGLGNTRFVLDLCIAFFTFYAINLTNNSDKYKIYTTHYGELFLYILPIIFGLYVVWDIVKYYEYKKLVNNNNGENTINSNRLFISGISFIVICIQSIIFYLVDLIFISSINVTLIYLSFTISSFIIVIKYRSAKWKVPVQTYK